MFEKLFGKKTEEQIEVALYMGTYRFFDRGIDALSVYNAFKNLQAENRKNNYRFTNNRLLNIVKDCAVQKISPIDESLMGGREGVIRNIDLEIEKLRNGLTDEEKSS